MGLDKMERILRGRNRKVVLQRLALDPSYHQPRLLLSGHELLYRVGKAPL